MFETILSFVLSAIFLQVKAENSLTFDAPSGEVLGVVETVPQLKAKADFSQVEITASSALVIDRSYGTVLFDKKGDEIQPIASLTKLMTALVFLDYNPGWQKQVKILASDYRVGGITYLISGEKFTTQDLFYAALVASSNEAAVALARSTGMSQEAFVSAMNKKASELNMTKSEFVDVTGLSEHNLSSAGDVAKMLKAALTNRHLAKALGTSEYNLEVLNRDINRKIKSTDLILGQNFGQSSYMVKAGKTGYLNEAGYCFAGLVGDQADHEIISVVLGSKTLEDRFSDTKILSRWVYENYQF